jgi:hypothetical protein
MNRLVTYKYILHIDLKLFGHRFRSNVNKEQAAGSVDTISLSHGKELYTEQFNENRIAFCDNKVNQER